MKMIKSVPIICMLLASTIARAGDSLPFMLDTRDVTILSKAKLSYDSSWLGGDPSATVVISDNGSEVYRGSGVGDYEWTSAVADRHMLTYTTYIDGVAQDEVYEAIVYSGCKYDVVDGKVVLRWMEYQDGVLNIPSEIDGYPVAEIAAEAFAGCSDLTSVAIPSSVERIGCNAFANCTSLKKVFMTFALKTQIEAGNVFAGCSDDLEVVYRMAEIANFVAKQRFPWNGKVDISFVVIGDMTAGLSECDVPVLSVYASNCVDGVTYRADRLFLSGDIGNEQGLHKVVWDMNAQGINIQSDDVVFSVMYSSNASARYCVVDLSPGKSASKYPVTYYSDMPSGGWTDDFKTTKLVLRLIESGSFKMNGSYDVTLTKAFYCGVFEVTQKQYELVTGSNPSNWSGDTLPVENVSWNMIRGDSSTHNWPTVKTVDSNSFVGRLQARTGLDFDLPTEVQWEYACRAGTTTTYYWGDSMDGVYAWYSGNSSSRTHSVGTRTPNAWGLYDMSGNVWEWCLDWFEERPSYTVDFKGPESGTKRIFRGGGCRNSASWVRSIVRSCLEPDRTYNGQGEGDFLGMRLAITLLGGTTEFPDIFSDSNVPVKINSQINPMSDSIGILYDASWVSGDANAIVVISDNGTEVKRVTGSGEFVWSPTTPGKHTLTYTTYINGVVQDEVYTATVFKDWMYTVLDGKATIVDTTQKVGNVTIPSEIDGYPVVEIAAGAFAGCSELTSVTIPNIVTNIATNAFSGCVSLRYVELPYSLKSQVEKEDLFASCLDDMEIVYVRTTADPLDGEWHEGSEGVGDGVSLKFSAEDSSSVWIETVVTNAGRVSFDWKISCEKFKNYKIDYFSFLIDGQEMVWDNGEVDWTTLTFEITGEGEHTLRWAYTKDDSGKSGQDCAWLKDFSFTPLVTVAFGMGDAEGGSLPENVTGYSGSTIVIPEDCVLTKAKHAFAGWTDGVQNYVPGDAYTLPRTDITLLPVLVAKIVEAPVIEVAERYYTQKTTVSISCQTEGARIYYTIDGSEPTAESNLYEGPFEVAESAVIRAFASKDDWFSSEVTQASTERAPWTSGECLNSAHLSFLTDGGTGWARDMDITYDGQASMKSGAIGDSQESSISLTVDGPGVISFWWKVSSESYKNYQVDYLSFTVDGVERSWICGDVDWRKVSFAIEGDGTHEVKWIYKKDAENSEGSDAAWLDEVMWKSASEEWPLPDPGTVVTLGDWYEALSDDEGISCARWEAFWMGANVAIPVTGLSVKIPASKVEVTAGTYSEFGTPYVLSESEMWNTYGAPVKRQVDLGNVVYEEEDGVWANWETEDDFAYELSDEIWPDWEQIPGRQWIVIPTGVPRAGTHTFGVRIKGVDHDEYTVSFELGEDQRPLPYEYKVTFDANGGAVSQGEVIVEKGKKLGVLPVPTRSGYTFTGWFTASEGGTQVTADTVVTGDMTLFARWEVNNQEGGGEAGGAITSFEPVLNGEWHEVVEGVGDVDVVEDSTAEEGASVKFTANDSSSIWIETVVTNAGRVSFDWKISCEKFKDYKVDYFSFLIDGQEMVWDNGEVDWTNLVYEITVEGEHVLRWAYTKDESGKSGQDCAWLKDFSFTPLVTVAFGMGDAEGGRLPDSVTGYSGSTIVMPQDCILRKAKYTFAGWTDGVQNYVPGDVYTLPRTDITLLPVWTAKIVEAPIIEVAEIYYTQKTTASISCQTEGARIYYTLDGSEPTTESNLYEGPFEVEGSAVIRAFACKDDWFSSEETQASTERAPWTSGECLNSAHLSFLTDGGTGWARDMDITYDGQASMKSGAIGDSQESSISLTVDGPGVISFWWKVSSESYKNYQVDYLSFTVDGVEHSWICGDVDWGKVSFFIEGDGAHEIKWIYKKDAENKEGDDAAWLDKVMWRPRGVSLITYTNLRGATHSNPETYQEGTLVSFTNPSGVAGYTFAGWTPPQITADMTGEQTVTANWNWHPQDVTVEASITGGKEVPVKAEWVTEELDRKFGQGKKESFIEQFGDDFASALLKKTGKRDSAGNELCVWHDYVAGTDPTDADSVFRARIEMVDGKPVVSWDPDLNSDGEERVYLVHGKEHLMDSWHLPVTAIDRFFKVEVSMPFDNIISFDVNGGSSIGTISIRIGQPLGALPEPTREGYTFLGWFTALEDGDAVTPETIVTNDMTIYARWAVNTYTVTFNANGGEGGTTLSRDYGLSLGSLPTPTREGYTFAGWWTATSGGTQITSSPTVTGNVIYYAHWQKLREKVQLWEDGPYWATTNIGAEKPEDYGYYFWWGDTVGYKRENDKWVASDGSNSDFSFSSDNTPTYEKSISTLKYKGWITSDGVLAPEHDAANIHWGNGWRMPTKDEFDALLSNCDWTWTKQSGVNGYVVKGRGAYASNSIFLPAAGYGRGTSLNDSGSDGNYWSSVPYSDSGYAWNLGFYSRDHNTYSYGCRYYGRSVRPVLGFTK